MGITEISILRPAEIESESFRIIEEELRQKGRKIPEDYKHVLLRVIHTTADFEYLDMMAFSEDVLMAAEDALRRGAHIVTDTTMAMAGMNKRRLALFGGEAHCFIADTDVAEAAQEAGTTRSAAAVHKAVRFSRENSIPLIFAVGNAPTALLALEGEIGRAPSGLSMSSRPRSGSWRQASRISAAGEEKAAAMWRRRSATRYFII